MIWYYCFTDVAVASPVLYLKFPATDTANTALVHLGRWSSWSRGHIPLLKNDTWPLWWTRRSCLKKNKVERLSWQFFLNQDRKLLYFWCQLQKVHSRNLLKRDVYVRQWEFGSMIVFHLSKLWKANFFILCDAIFLVRLQGKFEIDFTLGSERVKSRRYYSSSTTVTSVVNLQGWKKYMRPAIAALRVETGTTLVSACLASPFARSMSGRLLNRSICPLAGSSHGIECSSRSYINRF